MFGSTKIKSDNFRDRLELYKKHDVKLEVRFINSDGTVKGYVATVGDDYIDIQDDEGIMTIPLKNVELVYFNKSIFKTNNTNT